MDSYRCALAVLLAPHIDGYTVVDVGAHGTGEAEVYAQALIGKDSVVIGFEPNARECARLNEQLSGLRKFFPYAIGDGMRGIFHVCQAPLTSSLLRPNRPLLVKFEGLAEMCEVVVEAPIDTVRLDDIGGIEFVDFLKLDIQGATLVALENAERLLDHTLVVHAEMEFVPIYAGESLFSECEIFLRHKGFMFHHFHNLEGRRMTHGAYTVGRCPSQTLWADAVFVPSLRRLDRLPSRDLIRLAWTMDVVYGACDMAMACLARCTDAATAHLSGSYHRLLAEHGRLA